MATAANIIERALQDAGIVSINKSTSGTTEETYALRHLNDMLSEWLIDGIDIAHVTLAASDTLDVPDDHLAAITANLAVRLVANGFGGEAHPGLIAFASGGKARLVAYHFTLADLLDDNPLSRGSLSTTD